MDNGKLSVLTSARREDGFPPKWKTSTGNKLDFRSPSPSQKSALLKVPFISMKKRDIWRLRSFAGMSSIFLSSPAEVTYHFHTFMLYRVLFLVFSGLCCSIKSCTSAKNCCCLSVFLWLVLVRQCFQCLCSRLFHQDNKIHSYCAIQGCLTP